MGLHVALFFLQGHPEEMGKRKMQEVTCSLFYLLLGLILPKGEGGKLKAKWTIFIGDALGPKTPPCHYGTRSLGRVFYSLQNGIQNLSREIQEDEIFV